MLAASVSLVTPFEPACILVYSPGKYRFWDFIKVGTPLTVDIRGKQTPAQVVKLPFYKRPATPAAGQAAAK